jgi:predicted solute-binding protein
MTKPNAARGIGAIRKDVTPQVATDVRRICELFIRIAEQNPQAVQAAFSDYLKSRVAQEAESGARMVQFYVDNAEYLLDLFHYQ